MFLLRVCTIQSRFVISSKRNILFNIGVLFENLLSLCIFLRFVRRREAIYRSTIRGRSESFLRSRVIVIRNRQIGILVILNTIASWLRRVGLHYSNNML